MGGAGLYGKFGWPCIVRLFKAGLLALGLFASGNPFIPMTLPGLLD